MSNDKKRNIVLESIKNKLRSGTYDYNKFKSMFPYNFINESTAKYNSKEFILKCVIGLDLSQELSSKGVWDYARLEMSTEN